MKHPLQYISMLSGKTVACCFLILMVATGCKKYLEVPPPINSIAGSEVFENDYSSAGALNSVYSNLYTNGNFDGTGVGLLSGLYADELTNFSLNANYLGIYTNSVNSSNGNITVSWPTLYKQLYSVNLAIEGLTIADNLNYRDQWLGEAYFLRGLIYFYLTNMYKDVPLVLGSDYLHNNGLARNSQADVYAQIVEDLLQAQSLLPVQYRDGNGTVVNNNRARPNKAAATALLARVYLYLQDWQNAATQAGNVIANAADYQLVHPAQTFLANSREIIWGIVPVQNNLFSYKVKDVAAYFIPKGRTPLSAGVFVTLTDSLVKSFEANDLRYTNWVGIDSVPASGATPAAVYYFAYKYKANGTYTAAQESVVMLRFAEQYLIRAEARAKLNDLNGALADLNAVRTRANLPASTATSQPDILNAIQKERRVELFTEVGHRYFDLRRTGALDALMTKITPLKGGSTWSSFEAWWPIPLTDIQNNPRLEQTFGYQ